VWKQIETGCLHSAYIKLYTLYGRGLCGRVIKLENATGLGGVRGGLWVPKRRKYHPSTQQPTNGAATERKPFALVGHFCRMALSC